MEIQTKNLILFQSLPAEKKEWKYYMINLERGRDKGPKGGNNEGNAIPVKRGGETSREL